jgi:hypothetical protein
MSLRLGQTWTKQGEDSIDRLGDPKFVEVDCDWGSPWASLIISGVHQKWIITLSSAQSHSSGLAKGNTTYAFLDPRPCQSDFAGHQTDG